MSGVVYSWSIKGLEFGAWTSEWNPAINPTAPKDFEIELVGSGLRISCAGTKFAGALAKNTAQLPYPSQRISFVFKFKFSDSIVYGQVVEADMKVTDANGWTYDGSFQLNIPKGWMGQINDPWVDTGVKVAVAQDQWNQVQIDYALDYVAHTITILAINGTAVSLPPIAAKQVGWDKGQIVTQLQLCTASVGGEYEVTFSDVGYKA
jgi:hypothetical protein